MCTNSFILLLKRGCTHQNNVFTPYIQIPLVVPITLYPQPCPVGYMLGLINNGRESACVCNHQSNDHIQNCQQETLQLTVSERL